MIYVTIGNAGPFPRLTNAIPDCEGEAVIIQDRPFTRKEHARYIKEASVVVCHGGAGTILQCFEAQKLPVVVPRRKHWKEHCDDHQYELTKALANYGMVIPVYGVKDLLTAIQQAKEIPFPTLDPYIPNDLRRQLANRIGQI